MKIETFEALYREALNTAEEEKRFHDEVEIALVPVVICKHNGKVGSISGVDTKIIFSMERGE